MLNRRKLLQGFLFGGVLNPKISLARPLGGIKDDRKPFRFKNATILDSVGRIEKNWGGEVIDGRLHLIKDSNDGEDMKQRWIVPNFIDSGCTVGLYEVGLESGTKDISESQESEQPLLQASDGYNPLSEVIPTIRANGIGTVLVHPSIDRLVAGSMSAIYTAGISRSDILCKEQIGLCVGLGSAGKGHGGPSTRMGIAARLREVFSELSPSVTPDKKWWKKEENPPKASGEDVVWQLVADKKLPVLFSAQRADDIEFALELIKEFSLQGMIIGGAEAWIHASRLASNEVPVLLGSLTIQPNSFEHVHARYDNAKLLFEAGVSFAFRTGQNHNSRWLPSEAAVAVAHGLPYAEAIRALCNTPSKLFPSIPKGFLLSDNKYYDANFFICDGDPLQPRNNIDRMWINGFEVDLRTRQTDLYEQYKTLD
jgi:imidazolonepropionase-like amidohydrolase